MGHISEEIQEVIRSGTFFCISIINFRHLESHKDKTKLPLGQFLSVAPGSSIIFAEG